MAKFLVVSVRLIYKLPKKFEKKSFSKNLHLQYTHVMWCFHQTKHTNAIQFQMKISNQKKYKILRNEDIFILTIGSKYHGNFLVQLIQNFYNI